MKSVKMAVTELDLRICCSTFRLNVRDKWNLLERSKDCSGFSLTRGSKAQRSVSSSASPVGMVSDSAGCCHLHTKNRGPCKTSIKDWIETRTVHPITYISINLYDKPWFFNGKGIVSLSLLSRFRISRMSLEVTLQKRALQWCSHKHTSCLDI